MAMQKELAAGSSLSARESSSILRVRYAETDRMGVVYFRGLFA